MNTMIIKAEKLQADSRELKSINERQEKRVRYHRTRAENLTVAYLLLQVLFLLVVAVRSSSSAQKSDIEWLLLFFVVLISSLIFFLAFLDAAVTFYKTQSALDDNRADLELMLRKLREAEEQKKADVEQKYWERSRPDVVLRVKRKLYIYVIASALLVLAAIELYACRLFLRA